MRAVSIYTATSIKGRWERDGYIGYTLEYYPPGRNLPEVRKHIELVESMNANRAEICELSIYTDSEYLFNGFAGREDVTRWIRSGWITTRGQSVKNKDKWLELIKGKQGHLCSFYLKQPNAYTKELIEEMERREK